MNKFILASALAAFASLCHAVDTVAPAPQKTAEVKVAPAKVVAPGYDKVVIGKTYSCSIVKAVDGDTLDATCAGVGAVRVRVADVDTPEKGQPFYKEATQFATDNAGTAGKINVAVVSKQPATPIYPARIVGRVFDTKRGSYGKKAVEAGFAWAAPNSSMSLKKLEGKARNAKKGLWIDATPIPPWEWRSGIRPVAVK